MSNERLNYWEQIAKYGDSDERFGFSRERDDDDKHEDDPDLLAELMYWFKDEPEHVQQPVKQHPLIVSL